MSRAAFPALAAEEGRIADALDQERAERAADAALTLTPALRSMLKRVAAHNGRLLLFSVTESGGNAARLVRTLIDIGLVETCTHPNARHAHMAALRLTTKGIEAARELK